MTNSSTNANLRTPTSEEAREIGRKGGINSGEARRKKKTMREWAKVFGDANVKVPLPDGTTVDSTLLGNIVAAQMQRATKGDTKAAKFVAELLGEMQQNINIEGPKVLVVSEKSIKAADKWNK